MKKRVLVGREDPEGMPGDVVWEPEHEENPDDTTKVWIGKVRFVIGLYRPQDTGAYLITIGAYYAALDVLYSSRTTRPGFI
jgi:hypothetical protein